METRAPTLTASALAVAAIALGAALQVSNGNLAPGALVGVTVAIVFATLAVVSPRAETIEKWGEAPVVFLLGAGLVAQVAMHLTAQPGIYAHIRTENLVEHHVLIAAAAVLGGALASKGRWLGRACVPALLGVHFLLGLWLLREAPSPDIDVMHWHRAAFSALAHGVDPYAIQLPNIYEHTLFYPPGMATATTVDVGYVYPPLSLLLSGVGHVLVGDCRYAHLAAYTASGALMAYARPGRLGALAAALFLLTPRSLLVLELSWTEPLVVLALAATVFCACRAPKLLPYAFGALLGIKQYLVLALPLAVLLLPAPFAWRASRGFCTRALGVAALTALPFALPHPLAFFHSLVGFLAAAPFRPDALTYGAALQSGGAAGLPAWLGWVLALASLGLALWRAPRTPAGFAAALAFVSLFFFAFGKYAFCNYYFFVVGALCCALAAMSQSSFGSFEAKENSPLPS